MIVQSRLASFAIIGILGIGAGLGIAVLATRDPPQPHPAITRFVPEHETPWTTLEPPAPKRVVLLIHGLDEPGSIWDELAPAIHEQGATVARFDYPNDQHIAESTLLFQQSLAALRDMGVTHLDLVCHSMGGLVARDALSRPADESVDDGARAIVDSLILVGSPNAGSSWARFRIVSEIREHALRAAEGNGRGSVDSRQLTRDGQGEAGADLMPGSDYLVELNDRPPLDVPITIIAGHLETVQPWAESLADAAWLERLVGNSNLQRATAQLAATADQVGDGVVTVQSAMLPGIDDVTVVEASHRGLLYTMAIEQKLRRMTGDEPHDAPPASPIILDRLGLTPAPFVATDPTSPDDVNPP